MTPPTFEVVAETCTAVCDRKDFEARGMDWLPVKVAAQEHALESGHIVTVTRSTGIVHAS